MRRLGFTLIEILIAITIIAFMAAAIAPFIRFRPPGYERNNFVIRLNALMQLGLQQAIVTGKVHRIVFDIKNRIMRIEKDATTNPQAKKQFFEPLKNMMVDTTLKIPNAIEIKQFWLEGFDEMSRFAGGKTTSVWFYIIPDGMTQRVTINILDKEESTARPQTYGLVLNPFTAQFKVYDDFQR